MTKFDAIEAQQDCDLARVLKFLAQQEAAKLGHGFHQQHTRHDWSIGIVALEEGLIDRDILHADGPLVAIDLKHAINKQHRIPVWHDPLNPANVHCRSTFQRLVGLQLMLLLDDALADPTIQRMPTALSNKSTLYLSTSKVQIAEHVEHLVTYWLI